MRTGKEHQLPGSHAWQEALPLAKKTATANSPRSDKAELPPHHLERANSRISIDSFAGLANENTLR